MIARRSSRAARQTLKDVARRLALAAVVGCVGAACGDSEADSGDSAESGDTNAIGISAEQVDGIWMFFHSPQNYNNALHGGSPSIVDDCLFVGDAVVVWHTERRDEAEDALASALTGESLQLSIGGGGISLDEGEAEIPEAIAQRCTTREVWFGSPE